MTTRRRVAAAAAGATVVASPVVAATTCIVHPGDTLSAIAIRHGTTVQDLVQANGIRNPRLLRIGQLLQIPDNTLGQPAYVQGSSDTESYTTRRGETLIQIARAFGVDPIALARTNGIQLRTHLAEGTVLQVPGRMARVNALLVHVAAQVGVDAKLVKAVAWMESGWRQDVVSPTGAVGIMQVEPYTGEWVSEFLAGRPLDIQVAGDNVLAGTLLLKHLLNTHNGDVPGALSGYYQGDASVAANGLYADTKRYQAVVSALMRRE